MRLWQVKFLALIITGCLVISCNQGPKPLEDILRGSVESRLNPYGKVPMGALLTFRSADPCQVEISIDGPIPVTRKFSAFTRTHAIPVLGMYADTSNTIHITLTDKKDNVYTGSVAVKTEALPGFFPEIDIVKVDRSKMEPGFHLIELLVANNGLFHSYTLMFDDNGAIRWYMDMSSAGKICYSPLRLKNGNWLYLSWIDLYELDELGQLVRKDQMWGHAADHHIIELPNGNLLMGGSKKDASVVRDGQSISTRYDYIIEWERTPPGRTVKEWDLGQVLDVNRAVFPSDYSLDVKADWFHINSIAQSHRDQSLIASGRNQGVVKVDALNNPKWILAPHKSWGKSGRSGNGFNTSDFLLTAVDTDGAPYPEEIQQGLRAAEDFEWPTGQHSISVLDNGNVVLFDNGLSRNFENKPAYSRAVEYRIDEDKKTIQQVWEYGKSRGLDMFSGITSEVDLLPVTGNRLITAGSVRLSDLPPHSKMVELTYPDNEEVFEANIYFKDLSGTGAQSWAQFDLVYRGERYPLFLEEKR